MSLARRVVIFATRVARLTLPVDVVTSWASMFMRAGEVVDRRSSVGAEMLDDFRVAGDEEPSPGEFPKVGLRGARRHEAFGSEGLGRGETAAHLLRPVARVVRHAQHDDQLAGVLEVWECNLIDPCLALVAHRLPSVARRIMAGLLVVVPGGRVTLIPSLLSSSATR
ncbi:hypothetical protein SGPA1_80111 [Streptomyces misionensis JCM 4497]